MTVEGEALGLSPLSLTLLCDPEQVISVTLNGQTVPLV